MTARREEREDERVLELVEDAEDRALLRLLRQLVLAVRREALGRSASESHPWKRQPRA
jgi:hypothetical protein